MHFFLRDRARSRKPRAAGNFWKKISILIKEDREAIRVDTDPLVLSVAPLLVKEREQYELPPQNRV